MYMVQIDMTMMRVIRTMRTKMRRWFLHDDDDDYDDDDDENDDDDSDAHDGTNVAITAYVVLAATGPGGGGGCGRSFNHIHNPKYSIKWPDLLTYFKETFF